VLRAIAGAAATDLPISEWFFIVTSFGALLVVVGKRESELHALGARAGETRSALAAYTPEFLRSLRSISAGVVLVAYCLWAFDSAGTSTEGANWFELSIVPFAVAIFQYTLIVEKGEGENPEEVLTTNRAILASGALWAIIYAYAVYRT
jgi:decaprenyl-phosphate phosphoribosyltransferase